jgi:hypothetical protein
MILPYLISCFNTKTKNEENAAENEDDISLSNASSRCSNKNETDWKEVSRKMDTILFMFSASWNVVLLVLFICSSQI